MPVSLWICAFDFRSIHQTRTIRRESLTTIIFVFQVRRQLNSACTPYSIYASLHPTINMRTVFFFIKRIAAIQLDWILNLDLSETSQIEYFTLISNRISDTNILFFFTIFCSSSLLNASLRSLGFRESVARIFSEAFAY